MPPKRRGRGRGAAATQPRTNTRAHEPQRRPAVKKGDSSVLRPLLPLIFRHLDESGLAKASAVSRDWYAASTDSRSYSKTLNFPIMPKSRQQYYGGPTAATSSPTLFKQLIQQRCNTLTTLRLGETCTSMHINLLEMIPLDNLKRLYIDASSVDVDALLSSFEDARFLPSLVFLSLGLRLKQGVDHAYHRFIVQKENWQQLPRDAQFVRRFSKVRPSVTLDCRECPTCKTVLSAREKETDPWPNCSECKQDICNGPTCKSQFQTQYKARALAGSAVPNHGQQLDSMWQCAHCENYYHNGCRTAIGCFGARHKQPPANPDLVALQEQMYGVVGYAGNGILKITKHPLGRHCGCLGEQGTSNCSSCGLVQCADCWQQTPAAQSSCSFCNKRECSDCARYAKQIAQCGICKTTACLQCQKADPNRNIARCAAKQGSAPCLTCLGCLKKKMPKTAHLTCQWQAGCTVGVCTHPKHENDLVIYKKRALCMSHFRAKYAPERECDCGMDYDDEDDEYNSEMGGYGPYDYPF